jgi:hypothetical protein
MTEIAGKLDGRRVALVVGTDEGELVRGALDGTIVFYERPHVSHNLEWHVNYQSVHSLILCHRVTL